MVRRNLNVLDRMTGMYHKLLGECCGLLTGWLIIGCATGMIFPQNIATSIPQTVWKIAALIVSFPSNGKYVGESHDI